MTLVRRAFTCFSLLAMVSCLVSCTVFAAETAKSPNIVFMYADDWRWDCIGAYQRDQGEKGRFPWLETPRIDKLAETSIRFDQSFVVNSLCSPGRTCVLTGQYSHLNGIIGNSKPLPVDTLTFPKLLQQAGYTTSYCGKWHLDNQRERPGFDYVASFVGQGKYNDCPIMLNGKDTPTHGWIDDIATGYAVQFLDEQKKSGKPFFLWLGFKSPHGPRGGESLPERARGLYAGKESRGVPNLEVPAIFEKDKAPPANPEKRREKQYEGHRAYMRHITMIDECVGRVLDALDKNGQAKNTVVIVGSDNGYYLGEHMLSDKRSAYDESMRVPLLIHMPGSEAKHGVNNDAMVLNIDYGPTILDLAGAKPLPEGQGRSLRPLLTGDTPKDWRDSFFYEYFKEPQYESPTVLALRTNTSKLITYPGHDEWTEVFDLKNDPFELKNLVGNAELLKKMRLQFDSEMAAVKFKMPKTPSGDGKSGAKKDHSPAADGG